MEDLQILQVLKAEDSPAGEITIESREEQSLQYRIILIIYQPIAILANRFRAAEKFYCG